MDSPGRISADLLLTAEMPADKEQILLDTFASLGVRATPRVIPPRRGVDQTQWLVLAMLPLQAFLSGAGTALADDIHQGLKALVGRLSGSKSDSAHTQRPLVLQDADTGLQVILEADLPEDAYQQLVDLDLSQFQLGPVHYDYRQRRWRSELDEADPDT